MAARVRAGRQRGYSLAIVTQETEIMLTRQRQRQRGEREPSLRLSPEQLTHSPLSRQVGRWAGRLSEWPSLPTDKGLWD